MQVLLQVFAGHSVVQVGHLDLCAVREGLGRPVGTRTAGCCEERRRPAGHAGGCAPFIRVGGGGVKVRLYFHFAGTMKQHGSLGISDNATVTLRANMLPGGPRALRQNRRAEVPLQVQLAEG